MKHVLTIAGSDSCSGAGVQADIKTIAALGGYGICVITAVTAQNTLGVGAIEPISPRVVEEQLEAVFEDIRVDAVKIGMLANQGILQTVATYLGKKMQTRKYQQLQVVIDPVMAAQSGDNLLQPAALEALKDMLIPLAAVVTPNIPEAETLSGSRITVVEDMVAAGKTLLNLGMPWVVVTGGHLSGDALDVLVSRDQVHIFRGKRMITRNNHGTGCTFSSALAFYLARGTPMPRAVEAAKAYTGFALAGGFAIGGGHGVLQHFVDDEKWKKEIDHEDPE